LASNDFWGAWLDAQDALWVLSSDGSDCAGAVDFQSIERFKIRLNAGPTAAIRTGNGQRDGESGVME